MYEGGWSTQTCVVPLYHTYVCSCLSMSLEYVLYVRQVLPTTWLVD